MKSPLNPSLLFSSASIILLITISTFSNIKDIYLVAPFAAALTAYMILEITKVQTIWDSHSKWHLGGSALLTLIIFLLFDIIDKKNALFIAETTALAAGILYEWLQREKMPLTKDITIKIVNNERGKWITPFAKSFIDFFTADMNACAGDAWWNIIGVALTSIVLWLFI